MPSPSPRTPAAPGAVLHLGSEQVTLRLPGRAGVVRQRPRALDHAADQALWVLRAWRTRYGTGAVETAAPLRPPHGADPADPSHADLVAAGAALTRTYLDGPVGAALAAALEKPPGGDAVFSLGLHVVEAPLKDLPWEALCHPGTGSPLALDPRVALYRSASLGDGYGHESARREEPGGPLRMLALIAAPEERGYARLDIETEERRLAEAGEAAGRDGRLVLELLEEGTWQALRDALHRGPFDLVHLSCHGFENGLCLERSDGGADRVTFDRLLAAFPDRAPRPALLVLSACASARGEPTAPFTPRTDLSAPRPAPDARQLPGLAENFASAGFPAVLAMTAEVTDSYATDFCARLYRCLAEDVTAPTAQVIARVRRELEDARRPPDGVTAVPAGQPARRVAAAEWATPALYAPGRPGGLRTALAQAGPARDRSGSGGRAPSVPAGSLAKVGRRRELQWLAAKLWQAGEPVQVTGLGGTGKTALVEEFLARRGVPPERVARLDDGTGAAEALARMTRALGGRADSPAARHLCEPGVPWGERVRRARTWFDTHEARASGGHVPEAGPAVVVADIAAGAAGAAEDRSPDGGTADGHRPDATDAACAGDPLVTALLTAWAAGNGSRRLVVTSRSPWRLPPGGGTRMAVLRPAPLGRAEAGRLARRLSGLRVLRARDLDRLIDGLGGHPRALVFASCLVRAVPEPAVPDAWPRLLGVLRARGVDGPEDHVRSVAGSGLGAVLQEAARAAAEDAGLPSLWSSLRPGARDCLVTASVFRTPVPARAVLPGGTSASALAALTVRTPPAPAGADGHQVLDDLLSAGLLSPTFRPDAEPLFSVPRWIATYLTQLTPQVCRSAHRDAAAHWSAGLGEDGLDTPADVAAAVEARYHYGRAGSVEGLLAMTGLLCRRYFVEGRFDRVRALSQEALTVVPPDSLLAADAHEGIGDCDRETGRPAAALPAYERALLIRRREGDDAGVVQSLHRLGAAETDLSRYEAADAHLRQALALNERLGDREETHRLYHSLTVLARRRGDAVVPPPPRQAGDAADGGANRRSRAARLTEAGQRAIDEGRYADALRCFEEALRCDREEPADRHGIAGTMLLIADVHLRLEQPDDLKAHAREALLLNERIGDADGVLRAYTYLAYAAVMQGDLVAARELAEHHLTLAERGGGAEDRELGLNLVATVARHAGDPATAGKRWAECLDSARRRGAKDTEGRYLHQLGVVAYEDGDLELSRDLLGQAAAILSDAGADAGVAESLGALARVLLTLAERTGRPELWNDALRALAQATLRLRQAAVQNAQLARNRSVYRDLVRRLGRGTVADRLGALLPAPDAHSVLALLQE
ncbi:CHAT domain-containing protein [Streptomyces sp. NPDC000987]|uniref:CHAT domain-containing protein n=1 Tax=Streptomyces sp. NPDC000987 TaxID=3154374 RepID=UPI00331A66EA